METFAQCQRVVQIQFLGHQHVIVKVVYWLVHSTMGQLGQAKLRVATRTATHEHHIIEVDKSRSEEESRSCTCNSTFYTDSLFPSHFDKTKGVQTSC